MIENVLQNCGLNSTESKVLLYLVNHGQNLASIISKRTGIKRPTVYAALENLNRMGLVNRKKESKANYYSSISKKLIPKVLELNAKAKADETSAATRLLADSLKNLETGAVDAEDFEVSMLSSVAGIYAEVEEVVSTEGFFAFFNPQIFFASHKMDELTKEFLKETAKNPSEIKEIVVAGPKTDWYRGQIENPKHLLKELPADTNIKLDMVFLKDTAYLTFYDQKRDYGIKVKSREFYQSMKTVFDLLWERL